MTRAIQVDEVGGPEVLLCRDIELPEPGPNELLIDVRAAGVNFIDVYFRTGLYPRPTPFVAGLEGAGVIQAVGADVGGFLVGEHKPGYRVWYVDPAGVIHLWMAGAKDQHSGDGQWFYNGFGTAKNGKIRAMTMDRRGNILIVANDHGYLRRISFQRLTLP